MFFGLLAPFATVAIIQWSMKLDIPCKGEAKVHSGLSHRRELLWSLNLTLVSVIVGEPLRLPNDFDLRLNCRCSISFHDYRKRPVPTPNSKYVPNWNF